MKYLLDANTCIEFLRERDSAVKCNLAKVNQQDVALCSVVKAELYYGAYRSTQATRNLEKMREFFANLDSLSFDDAAAEEYGRLRAFLAKQGALIGPNDLLIAAIALAHNVTLVTHNTHEFERVPILTLEDWQD